MNKVPCELCGKPIYFGAITKSDGKPGHIPLDPVAAIYDLHEGGEARRVQVPAPGEGEIGTFVSHWNTCRGIFEGKRPH